MKTFTYTIKDDLGIHARPAGLLVKTAKNFNSEITIAKDRKISKCIKTYGTYGTWSKVQGTLLL